MVVFPLDCFNNILARVQFRNDFFSSFSAINFSMRNEKTRSRSDTGQKKVFIQTFGCQMNEYDSRKMLEQLQAENFIQTPDVHQADVILVNTCAIREKAEHKMYSLLGRLSAVKRKNPGVLIGVGGCVAQQKSDEILARAPQVDLVFGTDNLFELPDMLARAAGGERVAQTRWHSRARKVVNFIPDFPAVGGDLPGVKASIAITKGCNNYCTFCVVPYTRGREVSREPDNIVAEAQALVARGVREITLLGQNVNSYRTKEAGFVDLLRRLDALPGLERIRYTSPHPKDFDAALAAAHGELPKLCEHLHLPVQSGSDRVLKAMRRHHTVTEYLEKITLVRSRVPAIALSTDLIVGFPGETEADFQQTLDLVRTVGFDHIFSFKFSPRQDTPAAKFDGQLSEAVKADRLARLHAAHENILQEKTRALVGSRQELLLEGPHPRLKGASIGRTRGTRSALVFGCEAKPGDLVGVEIIAARKFALVGREIGRGH